MTPNNELKSAEEWITDKEHGFGFPFIDDIQSACRNIHASSVLVDLIKQIQLNAFKAGMTEAMEVMCKEWPSYKGGAIHQAITAARDRKDLSL